MTSLHLPLNIPLCLCVCVCTYVHMWVIKRKTQKLKVLFCFLMSWDHLQCLFLTEESRHWWHCVDSRIVRHSALCFYPNRLSNKSSKPKRSFFFCFFLKMNMSHVIQTGHSCFSGRFVTRISCSFTRLCWWWNSGFVRRERISCFSALPLSLELHLSRLTPFP